MARVLVVDDSRQTAEKLSLMLRTSDHEPGLSLKPPHSGNINCRQAGVPIVADHHVPAYVVQEALDLLVGDRPDIVLLDLMISDLDGYETLCRLRENPRPIDGQ